MGSPAAGCGTERTMAVHLLQYQSSRTRTIKPQGIRLWLVIPTAIVGFGVIYLLQHTSDRDRGTRAKIAAAKIDVATLHQAVLSFRADMGRLPTRNEGLVVLVTKPASGAPNWHGPYLRKIPRDPWGDSYTCSATVVPGSDGFVVTCYGPDGKPGGGDDITD